MDYAKLAGLLFPGLKYTKAQLLEEVYPPRLLKEGALVTRFAPSPTGFMHIGGVFTANVDERVSRSTGGVLILRIEDTDKKREVADGIPLIIKSLQDLGIEFDEGPRADGTEAGAYGPYTQSARRDLYHAFCHDLVEQGHAYPCFCSEEEIAAIRNQQEDRGMTPGYWGEYARCRDLTLEEIEARLAAGDAWVLRLRSPGKPGGRVKFKDVIRGEIEMEENFVDVVLLKRDGLPTYHFAHVVDDTLMRVNQVIRGEEWIASAPIHLQMFWLCGLKAPKYAHVSPIMKEEDGGKRKLSKRKDPEAAVTFFTAGGYPAGAVIEYLLTIANSSFEDWRRQNPGLHYTDFPFKLNKMSSSGALFDLVKLGSVSAIYISRLEAKEVLTQVVAWSGQYDKALNTLLSQDLAKAEAIFAIDRGGPKPRKDIAQWTQTAEYVSYFYDETFTREAEGITLDPALQSDLLTDYLNSADFGGDKDAWFQELRDLGSRHGFSPDIKAYKAAPELFKGHVGDVSGVLRYAVTGRKNTPDLHAIMAVLGEDTVKSRIKDYLTTIGKD